MRQLQTAGRLFVFLVRQIQRVFWRIWPSWGSTRFIFPFSSLFVISQWCCKPQRVVALITNICKEFNWDVCDTLTCTACVSPNHVFLVQVFNCISSSLIKKTLVCEPAVWCMGVLLFWVMSIHFWVIADYSWINSSETGRIYWNATQYCHLNAAIAIATYWSLTSVSPGMWLLCKPVGWCCS